MCKITFLLKITVIWKYTHGQLNFKWFLNKFSRNYTHLPTAHASSPVPIASCKHAPMTQQCCMQSLLWCSLYTLSVMYLEAWCL